MPSPQKSSRALAWVALPLALTAGPLATGGLESGEVFANARQTIGGTTAFATDSINLRIVSPDPTVSPPLPPTFAPASASITGTMGSLVLNSTASINSTFFHVSSNSTALIEFVDNLVVNAEGIDPGTNLIVEVAWTVGGSTEFNGPDRIKSRSKILLEAIGIDLDPDPDAPDPPKQSWTRDSSNFVPDQFDDLGRVTFEFLVQAGTPKAGNIRLRPVAGVLCGGPGSNRTGNYDSSASANLTLNFIGATNVKTTDGLALYRWTTNAHSTLNYGSRDDDPPSNPALTLNPSTGGPNFVNLSWDTVLGEYYIVQRAAAASLWTPVTEVRGTGNPVSIDLFMDNPAAAYRLISRFGSGTPNPSLLTPELRVMKAGSSIRLAWQTHHWENHRLNEISSTGNSSLVNEVAGHGGVVWFDFPPSGLRQIFQIESRLK